MIKSSNWKPPRTPQKMKISKYIFSKCPSDLCELVQYGSTQDVPKFHVWSHHRRHSLPQLPAAATHRWRPLPPPPLPPTDQQHPGSPPNGFKVKFHEENSRGKRAISCNTHCTLYISARGWYAMIVPFFRTITGLGLCSCAQPPSKIVLSSLQRKAATYKLHKLNKWIWELRLLPLRQLLTEA